MRDFKLGTRQARPIRMDTVTEVQQQLAVLCSHFYATVGTLQRDAPSVSIEGETLLASHKQETPLTEQTQAMAEQVVQTAQKIDRLLRQLPDAFDNESDQQAHIQTLQQQHQEEGAKLDHTVRLAKQQLDVLQDTFAKVADQQIRRDNT